MENEINFTQFWYLIKRTTNSTGIRANWSNCLLYKVLLSGGREMRRSGTERQCSHNLQDGHPARWSADNNSISPTVNILIEARSEPAEEMIKNWKKWHHASLFFLHIVISHLNKNVVTFHINISLRLLRSVNTLNSNLKFKTIPINKSQLLWKLCTLKRP